LDGRRHMAVKILIMHNSGISCIKEYCMKTWGLLQYDLRLQRCCYQAFAAHMLASLLVQLNCWVNIMPCRCCLFYAD
jgi:hypothetical protein